MYCVVRLGSDIAIAVPANWVQRVSNHGPYRLKNYEKTVIFYSKFENSEADFSLAVEPSIRLVAHLRSLRHDENEEFQDGCFVGLTLKYLGKIFSI